MTPSGLVDLLNISGIYGAQLDIDQHQICQFSPTENHFLSSSGASFSYRQPDGLSATSMRLACRTSAATLHIMFSAFIFTFTYFNLIFYMPAVKAHLATTLCANFFLLEAFLFLRSLIWFQPLPHVLHFPLHALFTSCFEV